MLTQASEKSFFEGLNEGDVFTYSQAYLPKDVEDLAARRGVTVEYCVPGTSEYESFGDKTMKVVKYSLRGRLRRIREMILEDPNQPIRNALHVVEGE